MSEELKACPFCGGPGKVGLIVSTVSCKNCGARAGEYSVGSKAIVAWNTRVRGIKRSNPKE